MRKFTRHPQYTHRARLGDFWPESRRRSAPAPAAEIVVVPVPYSSPMQNLRWRLWMRDPHCVWCGFLYVDPDHATVEHLLPRAFGGGNTMANCRIACLVCNQKRGGWYSKQLNRLARKYGMVGHRVKRWLRRHDALRGDR